MKLKTYNYFHPSPNEKSLQKKSSKRFIKHSPRFEGEKQGNSQSFYSANDKVSKANDEITEYTKQEMNGFKTVFNTFDKDQKGQVSIQDLKSIFESFGRSRDELNSILSNVGLHDITEDGHIKFEQFFMIMQKLETEMDRTQDQREESFRGTKNNEPSFQNRSYQNEYSQDQYLEENVNQHYYTSGEQEQDEPQPAKFEVVDSESENNSPQTNKETLIENKKDNIHPENKQLLASDTRIVEQETEAENEETDNGEMPELRSKSVAETESSSINFQLPKSPTEKERRLYGAMLPKHGVYFLPELKVVDFIRVLHNYKRQSLKEGNLIEVKKCKKKITELRNKEMLRQLTNMCISHEKEIKTVEKAQRKQFIEFEGLFKTI